MLNILNVLAIADREVFDEPIFGDLELNQKKDTLARAVATNDISLYDIRQEMSNIFIDMPYEQHLMIYNAIKAKLLLL